MWISVGGSKVTGGVVRRIKKETLESLVREKS